MLPELQAIKLSPGTPGNIRPLTLALFSNLIQEASHQPRPYILFTQHIARVCGAFIPFIPNVGNNFNFLLYSAHRIDPTANSTLESSKIPTP